MKNSVLTHAHFQLTGRCNLACRFCGQSKGMLASKQEELSLEVWLRLADELEQSASQAGVHPTVSLWGGEPLLYNDFDKLALKLHECGFHLSIVTNGTLIEQHLWCIKNCINEIFISVDGIGENHDTVRGKGVWSKLEKNIAQLSGRRGKLIFLTTVSDCNVNGISALPFELAKLGADEIILQPLMYLTIAEIEEYRSYSRANFGCDYPELASWSRSDDTNYMTILKKELEIIKKTKYPFPVRFTPHAYHVQTAVPHCAAPFKRIHIRHDGEVGFCTDYFGFSAGNIKEYSLSEIFNGERADKFRKAVEKNSLSVCLHCPWRLQ